MPRISLDEMIDYLTQVRANQNGELEVVLHAEDAPDETAIVLDFIWSDL